VALAVHTAAKVFKGRTSGVVPADPLAVARGVKGSRRNARSKRCNGRTLPHGRLGQAVETLDAQISTLDEKPINNKCMENKGKQ
jgi:hypothetical protein